MTAPVPARVTVWGELRGEKRLPGVLRVLVGGQHAGAIFRDDGEPGVNGPWKGQVHGLRPTPATSHGTACEALAAVLGSSWARRLGARKASRVFWSDKASRLVARANRPGGAR